VNIFVAASVNHCIEIHLLNETTGYINSVCDKCALETGSLFKYLNREEVDLLNFEKEFRQYKRARFFIMKEAGSALLLYSQRNY